MQKGRLDGVKETRDVESNQSVSLGSGLNWVPEATMFVKIKALIVNSGKRFTAILLIDSRLQERRETRNTEYDREMSC